MNIECGVQPGERRLPETTLWVEHPLPPELGTCLVIHGFLSPTECEALINAGEQRGFQSAESDYPPSYRNNARQVLDDEALGNCLLDRLQAAVRACGVGNVLKAQQAFWRLVGLNERLRLCRYTAGQQFHIHQDGVHHRGADCQSRLTFMIYLTDGEAFEGGDTLFYATGPRSASTMTVVARLRPRVGSLILFDHGIWHAGDTVTQGVKYILRSDLLYQRRSSHSHRAEEPSVGSQHQGYVWTLASLSNNRIASGGRDGAIRVWNADKILHHTLVGHQQSVLGLTEVQPGLLASVSRDRSLCFWDVASQTCLRTIMAHNSAVLSLLHMNEHVLITAGADRCLALWSVEGEFLGSLTGHQGWVWALARINSDVVASASEDGSVNLWSIEQRTCINTWPDQSPLRTIDALASRPQATTYVATGDANGFVTLWTAQGSSGARVAKIQAHSAAVRRVRFLSDTMLATCGEDNALRVWKLPEFMCTYVGHHTNFVTDVVALSNTQLLSCGYDGILRLHQLSSPITS